MPDLRVGKNADILRFYLPLAATSVLMMVTHNVISGAISRTLNPAVAIAAYSAAYSVGQIFESPCYGLQRMCLTFGGTKRSTAVVMRMGLAILAIIASGYALTAWSPLSSLIFRDLLHVPDEVYPLAVASLQVFIMWPISSAIRSLFQSRIVLAKRTYWLTINMVARVSMMLIAAVLLPKVWPSGPVGSAILVIGITTEAVLAWVVAKFAVPGPADGPPDEVPVTSRQVLQFALPLAFAAAIQTLGKPVLTASLLRSLNPTTTLAGWQVSSSFSYILTALTYNIYHAVVVFVKDAPSFRRVQSFSLGLGVTGFILMAICSIPQIGTLVFERIIGSPPDVSREAIRTLAFLTLTAPAGAALEFYSGVLMLRRRASVVTVAKMMNTAGTCIIALTLVRMFPNIGAVAGAIAMAAGPFIEAAIAHRVIRTSPDFADLREPPEGTPQIEPGA